MKFLARFEAHSFPRRNGYFSSGARIPPNAGLPGTDIENSKAAQLDSFALGQRLLQTLEDSVHSGFSLDPGEPGPFDDVMDDVLLNQCLSPQKQSFLRLA